MKPVELSCTTHDGKLTVTIIMDEHTTQRYIEWSRALSAALRAEEVESIPSVEFRAEFCQLGNSLKVLREGQEFIALDEFQDFIDQ